MKTRSLIFAASLLAVAVAAGIWGQSLPGTTALAPLASPAFTGTPSLPTGTTAVTQSANDNSTKVATTAYANAAATAAASATAPYLTIGGATYGPAYALTAPTLAGWTVANSAVFSTSNGYLYITGATAGTAVRGIYATAPAAPYTRTYFVDPDISGASSASTGVGNEVAWTVGWRQNSSQKIITLLVGTSGGAPVAAFDYWTTAISFSAQHDVRNGTAMAAMATRTKYFVRLADDNTNLTVSVSSNGLDFQQIFQYPRGDFTTGGPDQIFLGVYPGSAPATLAVYSITNP